MGRVRITIDEVRDNLRIDRMDIDGALERQGVVLEEISDRLAEASSEMARCKNELEKEEARLHRRLKESADKISNEAVAREVLLQPSRISAWDEYQKARHSHEVWLGAFEAWKARGFALSKLADMQIAQVRTQVTIAGPSFDDARRSVREAVAAHASRPRRRQIDG